MPGVTRTRRGLVVLSLIVLGIGIWGVVTYFDQLDSWRLAGVAIIALAFYALAILGVSAEMAQVDSVRGLFRLYGKLWAVVILVVGTFCGGAWLLLVGVVAITPAWAPAWVEQLLFLLAFLGLVRVLIQVYPRVAERIDVWVTRRSEDGSRT